MSPVVPRLTIIAYLGLLTALCPRLAFGQPAEFPSPGRVGGWSFDLDALSPWSFPSPTLTTRTQDGRVAPNTDGALRVEQLPADFETQWILLGDSEVAEIGLETSLAELDWQWLSAEASGVALSIHPELEFELGSLDTLEVQPDAEFDAGEELLLPLELTKSSGPWTLKPRVGLLLGEADADAWVVALAMGWELSDALELAWEVQRIQKLGERDEWACELVLGYALSPRIEMSAAIEATAHRAVGEHELLFHLGARSEVSRMLDLLVAAGANIPELPEGRAEAVLYCGLEWGF